MMNLREYIESGGIESEKIHVVYTPSCGCEYTKTDILGSPKKTKSKCPKCSKRVEFKLTDPLSFYDPISQETTTLCEIMDGFTTHIGFHEEFLNAIQGDPCQKS